MGNGSEVAKIGGRPETEQERMIRLELADAKNAQIRSQNCMIEVKAALQKWNCIIDPLVSISGKGVNLNWAVVPIRKVTA